MQEKAVLPVAVTVRVGAGVIKEGEPMGEATIVFAHRSEGLCEHHVTLAIIEVLQRAVHAALVDAMQRGQQEEVKDAKANPNLVA